jgi:glucan biosynthesis protein C
VKFMLVLGGAAIALFASYHLLVRHSRLGLWLNGRRNPWRANTAALEAVAT